MINEMAALIGRVAIYSLMFIVSLYFVNQADKTKSRGKFIFLSLLALKVALDECVDGVLAYASDPAAPTAAYVAEKMKLPTNPYEAVMTLCNKDCFRHFLKNNGFNTPVAKGYRNYILSDM